MTPDFERALETLRFTLEPLRRVHAQELFELLSDERLYRFIPKDPPTFEALHARFERLETRASPSGHERWLNWVIRDKACGRCLGRIEVTARQDGSAFLAYEVGVAHWGRGVAAESCRRVLRMLFEDLGVARVLAEVDTRNVASIRLLERLGFERIGLREGADFFKGSSSDEFTYELGAVNPSSR